MIVHAIDPVLFTLGPLEVRWYGLIYAFGFLFGYHFLLYFGPRLKVISGKQIQDYFIIVLLSTVIGARIGSILSELPYYLANPMKVIAVWEGGLAFHGGFALAMLATYWHCRRHGLGFLKLTDLLVVPIALALSLGRIANFINVEFFGTPTSLPWGVLFPNIPLARHPAQLYEALLMALLFILLLIFMRKKIRTGVTSGAFLLIYGVGRFAIEYLKDPSGVTHILGLTWGQFWSIPMITGGLYLIFKYGPYLQNAKKHHKSQ